MKSFLRLKLCLIIVFVLFLRLSAQENAADFNQAPSEVKQAEKFDEFGNIAERDFAPKLKKFFAALRENNRLLGYVITYGDIHDTPFRQTNYFDGIRAEKYFRYLSCRCYDPPRLTFISGGLRENAVTELWLVPPDSELPEPKKSVQRPRELSEKLLLFGRYRINLSKAVIKKDAPEDSEPEAVDDEGLPTPSESYTKDFLRGLPELLNRDKSWRAVLIFYFDEAEFDMQKSRQMLEKQLQEYQRKFGLDLRRVKIVFGGYRINSEIENWIFPKDGIEPEPTPDEKIKAEKEK